MLCALSVDDVVRVAQELYSGAKADSLDAIYNEPAL
jgi:predicted nucleic-acid-binding protein